MRLLLPVLVAGALLGLAGCGSSDSSPTTATTASTVPTGRLGAQGAERCTPPKISGTTFLSFSAVNLSCESATTGLLSVYRTNRYGDWSCSQRISGRNVSTTCTNPGNTSQSFSSTWNVS